MAIKDGNQIFKLWLTRRFSNLFVTQLRQVTKNDPLVHAQQEMENKEQVMAFQQENSKAQHDIATTDTDLQQLNTEHPTLLATGITLKQQTLEVLCQEKKKLTLQLTTTLAYSMLRLMESALSGTEWGLSLEGQEYRGATGLDAANGTPFHLN